MRYRIKLFCFGSFIRNFIEHKFKPDLHRCKKPAWRHLVFSITVFVSRASVVALSTVSRQLRFPLRTCAFRAFAQPKPLDRLAKNFAQVTMSVKSQNFTTMVRIGWLEAALQIGEICGLVTFPSIYLTLPFSRERSHRPERSTDFDAQ